MSLETNPCAFYVMCNYAEIKKEKSDTDISDSNGRKRERARNDNMDNESKDPLHPTRSDGDNDRIGTESRPANMMASAPWWSRVIFRWPYPLLKLGLERPLEEIDLPEILPKDTSRYNREYLMELWDREKERCRKKNQCRTSGSSQQPPLKPSLHRAILRDFFHSMWYIQPCMFLSSTAKIVQALFLGKLIESFEVSGANTSGYIFAGVIVACGIVVLFEHRKFAKSRMVESLWHKSTFCFLVQVHRIVKFQARTLKQHLWCRIERSN